MLKLFITLNVKLWWRSVRGMELAAILFYSVFILLFLGQFAGIALAILFAPEIEPLQEIYPWLTGEIQILSHLVFINLLWFTQLFFTKISRLRLQDNRKLLAFGLPVKKLANYLNLAGFAHPINLLFTFFWLFYLGLMTTSALHFTALVLFILVNYGAINSFKWRFRIFSAVRLKWINITLASGIVLLILAGRFIDIPSLIGPQQLDAGRVIAWLQYTPGGLFYYFASALTTVTHQWIAITLLAGMLWVLNRDLTLHSMTALLTPSSSEVSSDPSRPAKHFTKWLGLEGGKYFYTIWSHPYSKIQLLFSYVICIPYAFFLGQTDTLTAIFLALIPVIFMMVMLTNMFGFENRELLLSLQFPITRDFIARERIKTALKITLLGSIPLLVLMPVLFESVTTIVQYSLGIFFVCLVFLRFVLHSGINNYKKIEHVNIMSVSNPVIPVSVTFTGMFMVIILGIAAFFVSEKYQWIHIMLLLAVIIWFLFRIKKQVDNYPTPFRKKIIPQLWNEL